MSKKMLINASHPEENRVAIVVDGILSELDIEIAGQEQAKGNIYKAVVVRVESGLQAAFVDYGAEKLGFLQIGEIHPNLYPGKDESRNRPRINEILQRGKEILVQIVKEERGNKGAALTTFLSIPGRYMVLMPDSSTKGVSRKIQDDTERKKLKKTMAELDLPQRMGYIVRTAGIGKEKEELKRDFDYLVRLFEGIVARKDQVKAPAQLYRESNLVIRSIRDYFSSEMDEVLIDDQKVYQDAKDFFSLVMPELAHLVKQHRERRPIFSRYQIEEQIDILAKNQIPLPSGGSIVIDQTEALVAIDVNSGKMSSESGIEATAAKTNLEAAAEVGRQLRLRDLGGLVVIDFIDMRDRKHIRDVEQELRKSLKDDKAKVTVGRISQFGLLEMSRQRLKPTLSVGAYLDCPHCQGKGRIKSAENQAVSLLRQIHAAASKGHIGLIEAKVPLEVANDLLNSKRQSLVDLERRLNLKISIIGIAGMLPGEIAIELHKREKSADNDREILPVTHANQIEMALAAASQPALVEVEGESAAESTTEPPAEQSGEEPAERKSKRRRRRRRRKTDHSSEEASEISQEVTERAAEATTATDLGTGGTGPTSEPARQTEEPEVASPESVATTAEPAPVEAAPASGPSTTESAPLAPATNTAELPPVSAEPQPENQPEPPADASAREPAPVEKPKRRRSRRPAAKKAVKEVASDPAQPTTTEAQASAAPEAEDLKAERPEQVDTAIVEKAEEKPAAKKPVRRSRKKPTPVEETPEGKAVAASQDDQQAPEEKPKPRPRRSRKKAPSPGEKAIVEAADSGKEEKPKRGRPRKTAKTAEPESDSKAGAQPAAEEPKRGRPRKTLAKTADPSAEDSKEQLAADKPKRGRPKKTAVISEDAPASSDAASEEKPKRRRRTTKKTDSPAEESPTE